MKWPAGMPAETRIGLGAHAKRGVELSVGEFSYGTPSLFYDEGDPGCRLTIGRFCSFADGVKIFVGRFGRHHYDFLSTYPVGMLFGTPARMDTSVAHQGELGVWIGSDVWIARDATIMAGVTIGDGAIVGAYSLVTGDVEPYAIVGGVPAKLLRKRFTPAQIDRLLRVQWWNLPEATLRANVDLFYSADIENVLRRLEELA